MLAQFGGFQVCYSLAQLASYGPMLELSGLFRETHSYRYSNLNYSFSKNVRHVLSQGYLVAVAFISVVVSKH